MDYKRYWKVKEIYILTENSTPHSVHSFCSFHCPVRVTISRESFWNHCIKKWSDITPLFINYVFHGILCFDYCFQSVFVYVSVFGMGHPVSAGCRKLRALGCDKSKLSALWRNPFTDASSSKAISSNLEHNINTWFKKSRHKTSRQPVWIIISLQFWKPPQYLTLNFREGNY